MNHLFKAHQYLDKHQPKPILKLTIPGSKEHYIIKRCKCGHYSYTWTNDGSYFATRVIDEANANDFLCLIKNRLPDKLAKEFLEYLVHIQRNLYPPSNNYTKVQSKLL
jgi:hypothetical protein